MPETDSLVVDLALLRGADRKGCVKDLALGIEKLFDFTSFFH